MKILIRDIITILVLSVSLALIFNAFSANPISLIPTPADELAVSDDILFGNKYKTGLKDLELRVSYDQMRKIIDDDRFVIVDARRPESFRKARIGNAVNIFPYTQDEEDYIDMIYKLPLDKTIIVYCDGGKCDLSHEVAEDLVNMGYDRVFIYHGGWEEWSEKSK